MSCLISIENFLLATINLITAMCKLGETQKRDAIYLV